MPEITPRLPVVSPHFDDGIFGCGSLLAAHPGSAVATVFAGLRKLDMCPDFLSDWDKQCGFNSSREAMLARLREDDGALKTVNAIPIRMPSFYDSQYGSSVQPEEIADELERIIVSGNFATIFFPLGLFHSDHVLVSDAGVIVAARQPGRDWFLYEEALYRSMAGLVTQRLTALGVAGVQPQPQALAPSAIPVGSDYRKLTQPVIASRYDYHGGNRESWHSHEQAQFVFTMRGVLRVATRIGMWTLGPHRGLWLAPRIGHELHAIGQVSMHSVYFEPEVSPWPGPECRVFMISPLLQELVAAMVEDKKTESDRRTPLITPLLLHEMEHAREAFEGSLPLPQDRRLVQICDRLIAEPANGDPLGAWGERVGASERTLARLFREETGLTFGQWRQQLRLVESVTRLAQGIPVATIAAELGYTNSSAFITMFKRTMGETPQRYLKLALLHWGESFRFKR